MKLIDKLAASSNNAAFYELITFMYNEGRWFNKISVQEVQTIFNRHVNQDGTISKVHPRIDAQQLIMIAKIVCQIMDFADKNICPLVNGLP